ncbi:PREDICTED: uncharacterized protein LOC106740961 isoform X2 [Dinoponera quadriceps]|uniref:Uncharacterized protein LOC106740961 isoform X2 n=1 Tax=Dinoponera quadriceps TaxID=609295 RepID=A0A6P3WQ22_DINQU|nr:PREDICTED: uncharacterized protein LOC106740961 isoform X2 [Dinoponera quadriceps]
MMEDGIRCQGLMIDPTWPRERASEQANVVIIIVITVVIADAYRNKRDVVSLNTDVISYYKPRPRDLFLDRSFIDKIIGQQTLLDGPVRDQTIGQQTFLDTSLRERSAYPSGVPIFHKQPFKKNLFHTVTAFRDEPLFRDALLKDHELRGERAVFRNSPFEGQSASLASEEIFGEQASVYRSQAPFKKQLLTLETPLKNLFHGQPPPDEQAPFRKQRTYVDFPTISNSIKFYRDDSYSKPIDSYGRQKDAQATSYGHCGGPAMYTEYGNHALELSSIPMVPFSEHLSALNVDVPVTLPSTPVANHGSASSLFPASFGISGVHSSDASRMKLDLASTSQSAISPLSGKYNTLVDNSSTMSSNAVTTVPSIFVNTNRSSIIDHMLTRLTTKPSSSVMATLTSIMPFSGNTLEPIHFHATKYGAVVAPSFISQNELKNNVHTYPLPETPNSNLKIDEHNLKYLMPEVSKNNIKPDNQNPMLNYILSEEQKSMLKGDIPNSLANNALPEVLKHGWSFQQFSQPEASSSYAPLSPNGKMKLILPNTSAASASAVSWPMLIKHDVPVKLPGKSAIASDGSTNNYVPLEVNLPLDFMTSMPSSLTASIPDSISGSITGGISTSIPGGMTTDMPAGIPTLNLGQSLHRAEQLRQTQEARNPWHPTGLQLQLGGFGGINYTLHASNPAVRPMELGIAKAGLTLPKLPQPHVPAFAKIGVGYQL